MSPSLGPSQMSELFCGSVDMTSETSVFTGVARARNEYVRGKRGPQMSFGARQARAVQISGDHPPRILQNHVAKSVTLPRKWRAIREAALWFSGCCFRASMRVLH